MVRTLGVDLTGNYALAFEVGVRCEQVPKELRTRTYEARIAYASFLVYSDEGDGSGLRAEALFFATSLSLLLPRRDACDPDGTFTWNDDDVDRRADCSLRHTETGSKRRCETNRLNEHVRRGLD